METRVPQGSVRWATPSVAFVSLTAPHVFAAVVSGIAAAVTTAFVQVGRWLRRQRAALGIV